ncbi:MAG: site-2 protease family protein [Nitrososphaerota archaeon]|nr:site-2 protease family protein [Nitrososphaerota archaeon]MDG6939417.1 site-2 protease family protein [Nitrososphaerota archaeon]
MTEEKTEFKHVELHLPLVLVKTRRGLRLMERMAGSRGMGHLAGLYLYIMPVVTAVMVYLGLTTIFRYLYTPNLDSFVRSLGPAVNILLPGINPILPFFYGWVALFAAMIVHEASHGIVARAHGLTVKDSGLLFFLIVPIGAFVEVDEKEMQKTEPRVASRVLAAGVGSNILAALLFLVLLLGVVSTFAPVTAYGGVGIAGVVPGSPAALAGLQPGQVIVSINGTAMTNITELGRYLAAAGPGDAAAVTYAYGSSTHTAVLTLGASKANASVGYMGIDATNDPAAVLQNYLSAWSKNPTAYIPPPTIFGSYIPFSQSMAVFYASPLGALAGPLANLLYWLWFVNFNLALFNALPIYPFDGGIAFRHLMRAVSHRGWDDTAVRVPTLMVTAVMVALIATMLVLPYVL